MTTIINLIFIHMKTIFKPFFLVFVASSILFTQSCEKEGDNKDTIDKASYSLTIESASGDTVQLIGTKIDSNWDSDLGIIWLGTDEENLPTGTLTIFINNINQDKTASAVDITLSTTNQLVGTSENLIAKLYHTGIGELKDVVVGANFISASLEEVSMQESNTGEQVKVSGWFKAKQ